MARLVLSILELRSLDFVLLHRLCARYLLIGFVQKSLQFLNCRISAFWSEEGVKPSRCSVMLAGLAARSSKETSRRFPVDSGSDRSETMILHVTVLPLAKVLIMFLWLTDISRDAL